MMITAGVDVMDAVRKRHPGDQLELDVGSFVAGCPREVARSILQLRLIAISGVSFDSIQFLSSVPGDGMQK